MIASRDGSFYSRFLIKTKSVFIDYIRDDIVSPIISTSKIIGNVYKYNSYNDFSKCIDYKKYIKNDKF